MQFTQDFFKPEIREEFEIPAMMKRAWAAQMEVLQVVADICEENGLQYFADGGTLLGAVRHQGFIPWDDDIDICLKREDYNRLISILQRQLPYSFVVSGMYARTVRLRMAANVSHLRVIADETLWNFNDYMKYFHGFPYQRAGIDIFPLDYIPVEAKLADIQKIMMIQGMNLLENWTTLEKAGKLEESLQEYEKLCNVRIDRQNTKNGLWKLTDAIASCCHKEEAEYITNYIYWIEKESYKMKKECYDEAVMLQFENIQIPVPAMYDEVLRAEYGGDYMTPVQGAADHDYPFYGHMEGELKKQIKAVGFDGSVEEFCQEVSSGRLRV